jgi:EAL and modified HD-GYP domain-containing signal transduction protein
MKERRDLRIFGSGRRRRKTPRLGDGFGNWTKSPWAPSGTNAGDYRFLALQPIFNHRRRIFGYEALSRSGWDNRFSGESNTATKRMIGDWMFHGLDELTGGRRTFLNCTREALVQGRLTVLPTSTVLELLETIEPDGEVLAACHRMKRLGYQIALDDFRYSDKMECLLELADFVKVDFRLSSAEERREIVCYRKRRAMTLLAEKIETNEEFEVAMEEGFRLFQGYYLGRPKIYSKRKLSVNNFGHFDRIAARVEHDSHNSQKQIFHSVLASEHVRVTTPDERNPN